jgi:hypothetical protein
VVRGELDLGAEKADNRLSMNRWRLLRLIGLVLGVCLAVAGLVGVKSGLQSTSWRRAPARIVMSEVSGTGEHRSSLVMAEYKIGDGIYQCGHVRAGGNNAASDATRYPMGASVTVAYDPAQVTSCALEPGVPALSIALLAAGAAFLGLAVFAHRRMVKPRADARG